MDIIDQSGVLDSTDGTATEKVEQLIDKAEDENIWYLNSEQLNEMVSFQYTPFEKLPRMNPIKVKNFSYRFSFMSNLKRVDFYINSESSTRFDNCFARDKALEYVKGINTANVTTFYDMFTQCSSLKTIEEPLDFSKVTNVSGCFWGCNALENIRIVPETLKISITISSPVLSDESIISIINGLATLAEGAAAQTLTLSKNLPLTEEQKQAIATAVNNKGWTLAFA